MVHCTNSYFIPLGGAVGSLSAVNSHMSEEGLLRLAPIQPLVSERAITPTTPEAIRRMKRKSKVNLNNNFIKIKNIFSH